MQKDFKFQQQHIYYKVYGKGRPVLLLHGFGEDGKVWQAQVDFLQRECLLVVPDLPGSGLSKINDELLLPDGTPPFATIEFYAECMYALLLHEGIGQCTVFGHSMGGYILLALVEQHPEMVGGFGLVHSTAYADSEEKKQKRAKGIEQMGQDGAHGFLKTMVPKLFAANYKKEHPEKIEMLVAAGKDFEVAVLQNYYRAMMNRKDRTSVVKGSKVPVMFIIGTDDTAIDIKDILEQTHLPECSYIHVHDSVGHMGMWEKPDEINNQLLHFLNR